ncbi:Mitochondrial translocator assembly and maintenance protein 41 [Apiospora marii]|uniref:Phosphatidate cytidylyltransferase, mitochondrial n=1 Tax=Apiospora marii TaxID=335849 RepID=A0ABR1S932_9PEZI
MSSAVTRERPVFLRHFNALRTYSTSTDNNTKNTGSEAAKKKEDASEDATKVNNAEASPQAAATQDSSPPPYNESAGPPAYDWEEDGNFDIEKFTDLPYTNFGVNQHIVIEKEFKECLRQVLWQFRAPVRYAFAYGSGVFPQSKKGKDIATEDQMKSVHPKAPLPVQKAQNGEPKMIDFIFGVTHTQHFHSLNMNQHRDHYSSLASLGSGAVSFVQDRMGAGVYFNTHVTVDGLLIKYGVVSLDTLKKDLRDWNTLYLAGRLHKPVKILRDDPQVRMANQINLLGAVRTALLMLPEKFTEHELYATIAGISYLGDPRMAFPTENPRKVANIVDHNMQNFRRLYAPLIESLPNTEFDDPACKSLDWISTQKNRVMPIRQDMNPIKRGNMVRRLPKEFRSKLYFKYQEKFQIPQLEFDTMMDESSNEDHDSFKRQQGGTFEQRIAQDDPEELRSVVRGVIRNTIKWPSTTQSLKGPLTAGFRKTFRYVAEKVGKYRQGLQAKRT